ncbi:MAG: type I-U CRISPR-associated helicase/endonuclease Cas3 [Pirellulaceae bacterium]
MNDLQTSDFVSFFQELYGYAPFPWQRMLVEQIVEGRWRGKNDDVRWPEGIDLPTASGKTACIDAAVFLLALAAKEGRIPVDAPARRRIFFVVDRRIVVDEAYRRADQMAKKLERANSGILREVADRLRSLAGGKTPLIASRLRGGTARDEQWRFSPAQPAVITSTVDQIGSRMLFRSYGTSPLSAPIDAALTACDSLILLDEAHCAVPFMQTARAAQRYAEPDWTETGETIVPPLQFSILSATLPADVTRIFPEDRPAALDHPRLQERMNAAKLAELVEVKPKKGPGDDLANEAVQRAGAMATDGRQRIAVMVNRVATASAIHRQLSEARTEGRLDADIVLITGRMRPIDRDFLLDQWRPQSTGRLDRGGGLQFWLGANKQPELPRPIILITTQCLEVGADLSFDALITECAALDALRQRFGRLNRLGNFASVDAVVLIRKGDHKPDDKLADDKPLDPIYANAMAGTWNWLNLHSNGGRFDFGIAAMDAVLAEQDTKSIVSKLVAPILDAPVLLPAHLDFFCQTSQHPDPDPDVSLFLHGRRTEGAETQVVFRRDLTGGEDWEERWKETVCLLPPLSTEALRVPLGALRKWLGDERIASDDSSDVEGQDMGEEHSPHSSSRRRRFVLWRGPNETASSMRARDVMPNDTVVVPADDEEWIRKLGHYFTRIDEQRLDVAEQAYWVRKGRFVLRATISVLARSQNNSAVDEMLKWIGGEEPDANEWRTLLPKLMDAVAADETGELSWIPIDRRMNEEGFSGRCRVRSHPAGGVIIIGPLLESATPAIFSDFPDENDDLSKLGVEGAASQLLHHLANVAKWTEQFSDRCLPASIANAVIKSAWLHDLGKMDERFQVILHGELSAAYAAIHQGEYLAKSPDVARHPASGRRLRQEAGLPSGFRHELLSMQIAENNDLILEESEARDLVLHIIASHHGHCRCFAPVVLDRDAPEVVGRISINGNECEIAVSELERRELFRPPHRLDSGVSERFWRLTRRHGWWGLAYLEMMLRLADRAASMLEATQPANRQQNQEVMV